MIVILTGAGISQESGIATFRDSGGLWEQERIEDVATPEGFARNPQKVYEFYNARRRQLASEEIGPNPAHYALARLEHESTVPVLVVTQNVDNLHERAGNTQLLHMHGELFKASCLHCSHVAEWREDLDARSSCPSCGAIGKLRPHIVWFGEMPLHMEAITEALETCSIFVSIGTSGKVYPAAGFSRHARAAGAELVELNMEPSNDASAFHSSIYGPASQVVPQWVEKVLAQQRA